MSISVIKVENISKQYRLGNVGLGSLSHDLNRWWYNVRGKEDPYLKIGEENNRSVKGESEYVWALRDINFEVKQGEVLGIIGRNGAGKSTLRKPLSRTTTPTMGEIKIKGRVASLLEVGTGFHPELTGRENIFLNGSILGMNKKEIKGNLDEIIDFAGVERYIDTPVKRYSSGMYVRLAFAVAAHLDPEILIIDEVLAVGDAEFQRKAMGKMQEVTYGGGRTVLFVSHNMQAISTLTNTCVFLNNGELKNIGPTNELISQYLSYGTTTSQTYHDNNMGNDSKITFVNILTSESGKTHIYGDPLEIEIEVFVNEPLNGGNITIQVFNVHNIAVTHYWIFDSEIPILRKKGIHKFKCIIPKCRLFFGKYTLTVYFTERSGRNRIQMLEKICPFEIEMFKSDRDHPWQKDSSIYLDEFFWECVAY
jgi:lipopolysaccharide transport system ATP-binding protein